MLRLPRQPIFHLTGLGQPWRWGWGPRSTSTQGRGPGRDRQGSSEPRLCTWPCSRPPGTALAARAPLLQAGAPASGLQREGLLGRLAERGLRVELALGSGRCQAGGSEAAAPRSALGAVGWAVPGGGAGTGGAGDRGRPGLCPHLSPGSQVLFNMAAAQCRLGLWAEATRSLEEAIAKGPEGACDLNTALGQVQVRGRARGRERGTRPALPSQAPELTQVGLGARSPQCGAHVCTDAPDQLPDSRKLLEGGGRVPGGRVLPTACGRWAGPRDPLCCRAQGCGRRGPGRVLRSTLARPPSRNRPRCSLAGSPGVRSSGPTGGTWSTWPPWIFWARPR